MSFIKSLFKRKPETEPTWDVTPASERPAAWSEPKPQAELPPAADYQKEERNPFLDDEALDTIQLEAEDVPVNDPYSTNAFETDFESDTRKLRTIAFSTAEKKSESDEFNPYDTGKQPRRGWKD